MPIEPLLHAADFGVMKTPEPRMSEELRVIRGFAPIIGLLAGVLLPATSYAQTNLDRGKSASQLFSSACIECHKAPHGLAKGKSAATVAEFLREHYTTSGEQAAALAAYVVAGRDTVASPGPGRKLGEHAGATTEDSKQDKRHAKPAEANAKSRDEVPSFMNPIVRPEPSPQEKPAASTRNRRKEPPAAEPVQEPAALAHGPAPAVAEPQPAARPEKPSPETAPSAAATAPPEPASGGSGEPVPRDNVPD
jgi:hypothetical protein